MFLFALSISFRRKPKSIPERILNGVIIIPFSHPIRLVTNLIQFGHEPVLPYRRYNMILQQFFWYYPGLFGYAQHIVRERGWLALYRGVVPSVIEGVVREVVLDQVRPWMLSLVNRLPLEEIDTVGNDTPDNVDNLTTTRATLVRAAKGFVILSVSGCLTEVVTRPFKVMALRAIAQHVGQESVYSSIQQAVTQIYHEEGIAGFYSGLVPAMLEHLVSSFTFEVTLVVIEEVTKIIPSSLMKVGLVLMKVPLAAYLANHYSYPYRLVSNMMAINNSGLAAASVHFSNWRGCWEHLSSTGNLHRASSTFFPRLASPTQ